MYGGITYSTLVVT